MRFLIFLWLLLLQLEVSASLVTPGDGPYYRLRRDRTLYIYDDSTREFIEQLATYHQSYRALYDRSFDWQLDEEQDLILASGNNQIANALAMIMPNSKSIWFPSGAGEMESMAGSSWLLLLDSHETAHIYQLSAKRSTGRFLKSIFGNTLVVFPFIWPLFPQPNFLLPHSFTEGNAVLNESRGRLGGRLHSGEKRAMLLAQVRAGEVNASRLINSQFKFPFGEANYILGGYFQAHLAAKYGIEKTNGFFKEQGDHYLWPLLINRTFIKHFGNGFYSEVSEYVRELQALASKQQVSRGEILLERTYIGPLNHDSSKVFFLATAGQATPTLYTFDRQTRAMASERLDLLPGKVFFDGDKVRTAASDQHDLHHIEYSLYGESAALDSRYRGQIVSDQRSGRTVAIDARNSWLDPHILLNGENFDIGHSNPILDEQGNVYYFRQNGVERLLYRNRQPVFKYVGFYGKLTEVSADGSIYFIANTEYGSTLYRFFQNEIRRVVGSDRVVDARRLNESELLITEITASGYRLVKSPVEEKEATPMAYGYAFSNETVSPAPAASSEATKRDERPYSAWREMRYSALNFSSTYSGSTGIDASSAFHFTDPLQYQSLDLRYSVLGLREQSGEAGYSFTKFATEFSLNYWWRQSTWSASNATKMRAYDQQLSLDVGIPLFHHQRWTAAWLASAAYLRQLERTDDPYNEELWGLRNRFVLLYDVPTPLTGFYDWRKFEFGLLNDLQTLPNRWTKEQNISQVSAQYRHAWDNEFYLLTHASYSWSERQDITVGFNPYPLHNQIRVSRLANREDFDAQNVGVARVEFSKVFNTPLYPERIPLGVRRIAPFVVAQGMAFDNDTRKHLYPSNLFEFGAGADFEFLLLHILPMPLRILQAVDTRDPNYKETRFELNLKRSF